MKFCAKCGAQLIENATNCSQCGAPVEAAPASQPVIQVPNAGAPIGSYVYAPTPAPAPQYVAQPAPQYAPQPAPVYTAAPYVAPKQTGTPSTALAVFDFLFAIFSIIAVLLFAFAIVEVGVSLSSYGYIRVRFWDDFTIPALICGIFAFGSAVTSFVMTLVRKLKLERIFSAITKMVASLSICILLIYILA